jgi:BASS family bile acid:Na+ symporter
MVRSRRGEPGSGWRVRGRFPRPVEKGSVMTLATLVPLVLQGSIALTVVGLGLRTRPGDIRALLRDRRRLARSLLAMNVVMPLLAVAVAVAFHLHPAVEVALVTLAVSPVPPLLPGKEMKAGGSAPYAVGLLFATALLSVVTVPAAVALVGGASGQARSLPPGQVAGLVLASVVVPLAIGAAVRRWAPGFAHRAEAPVSRVASVLLIAAYVPIVATALGEILSLIGNGTLAAIVLFIAAGLAIGHVLGGPRPEDRVVLALSTASRHPGVAAAAATAVAPNETGVLAAVLLYTLVGMVAGSLYVRLHRRTPPAESIPAPRRRRAGAA